MEFVEVLQNSGTLIVATTTVVRYACILFGFIIFVRAVFDFVGVVDPVNASRYLTQIRRPSAMGVFVKMIIAVIMAQMGLNLQFLYSGTESYSFGSNRCVSASWTTGTNERSIYLERQ